MFLVVNMRSLRSLRLLAPRGENSSLSLTLPAGRRDTRSESLPFSYNPVYHYRLSSPLDMSSSRRSRILGAVILGLAWRVHGTGSGGGMYPTFWVENLRGGRLYVVVLILGCFRDEHVNDHHV